MSISNQSVSGNISKYCREYNSELAKGHLAYLQAIVKTQEGRLATIENKLSQIIGQSSMVISIVALFVPIISDKISGLNSILVVVLVGFFLIVIFLFLRAGWLASNTLLVHKFPYIQQSIHAVTKQDREESELGFINSQCETLIFLSQKNDLIVNSKATSLIGAASSFRNANVIFVIFICLLCASLLVTKSKPNDINVTNFTAITNRLDSLIERMKSESPAHNSINEIGQIRSKSKKKNHSNRKRVSQ